jgi:hypothetical protein
MEKEESMSQSGGPKDSLPSSSFWSAIVEVIRGLKNQPILLFGFGLAIVVFAAGALALENLRVVSGSLLALAILVMLAWIASKAFALSARQSTQQAQSAGQLSEDRGGSVDIGKRVRLAGSDVHGGDVTGRKDGMPGSQAGGDVKVGSNSDIKNSKIGGGKVK